MQPRGNNTPTLQTTDRQTDRTGQRSDSIGRTVFGRPFLNRFALCYQVHSPQFSAHMCCGQMAVWIKMPLGREIGLGPSDIVVDGHLAPLSKRGRALPIFGPCLLCPNGCMDQDASWYGGRPRPRWYCVRWGPSSQKGSKAAPTFRPNGRPSQLLLSTCQSW